MNFLRRLLLNNIGLKAISLLLAFLMWIQIASRQTVESTVSIPVQFINMPAGLEISSDYEKRVDVVIRSGSPANLDERPMAAVIDLRKEGPGTVIRPLVEEGIKNRPHSVEILRIAPATIKVQLERTASKIVKVETTVAGQPARGYEVTEIKVTPGEVMITGPESRLTKISTAKTGPVSIDSRDSSFSQNLYVYLDDPRLRIENPKPVTVAINIEEKRRNVQLRKVPVSVLPSGSKVRLLTRSVDIFGTVPASFGAEMNAAEFQAVVDVRTLQANSQPYEIIPRIIPPREYLNVFRTIAVKPARVKIKKVG